MAKIDLFRVSWELGVETRTRIGHISESTGPTVSIQKWQLSMDLMPTDCHVFRVKKPFPIRQRRENRVKIAKILISSKVLVPQHPSKDWHALI